jgi:hypothetical protein
MNGLLMPGETDVTTGRGFYDFLSDYVGAVGETVQTGIETLGETAQGVAGTVGETVQVFPESAAQVGVAGAEAIPEAAERGAGGLARNTILSLALVGAALVAARRFKLI